VIVLFVCILVFVSLLLLGLFVWLVSGRWWCAVLQSWSMVVVVVVMVVVYFIFESTSL
jgi:hypothetical protein